MLPSTAGTSHAQQAGNPETGITVPTLLPTLPTDTAPPNSAPPPSGPAPTPAPQGPPPGEPIAPPSGEPEEDSISEPVPTDPVTVPPRTGPPPPPNPVTPLAQQAARATFGSLQGGLAQVAAARAAAARRVEALTSEVASVEARLGMVDAEQQKRAGRLQLTRERVKRVAVARYVATPVAPLNDVLEAGDFTEMARRVTMLGVVSRSDGGRIAEHEAAQREASAQLRDLVGGLDRARAALAASTSALRQADADLSAKKAQLDGAEAGMKLVAGGFVFPVAGNPSFTDTFGAPRMFGTAFAHLHEGTDIFAASGTPLLAAERGVLLRVGVAVLGGNKLWLVGQSGTRYFYAHLSAFAPGVADGKVVESGEVVGYVGNTGNARTTPAHLHFEVHPGGGPAVNPYPLLQIVDDAQRRLASTAAPGRSGAR